MKQHPQPSLGAACTTGERLLPKSTLSLSGLWDNLATHRQQAVYGLLRGMGESKGGTSQCPRAGAQISQRDKAGKEAQCCHPCPNAALTICCGVPRAASKDFI